MRARRAVLTRWSRKCARYLCRILSDNTPGERSAFRNFAQPTPAHWMVNRTEKKYKRITEKIKTPKHSLPTVPILVHTRQQKHRTSARTKCDPTHDDGQPNDAKLRLDGEARRWMVRTANKSAAATQRMRGRIGDWEEGVLFVCVCVDADKNCCYLLDSIETRAHNLKHLTERDNNSNILYTNMVRMSFRAWMAGKSLRRIGMGLCVCM